MPNSGAPQRGLLNAMALLAGRAAMVAGGVAVAVRFAVPAPGARRTGESRAAEGEETGRGRHGTPASRSALIAGHETADMNVRTMARVLVSLGSIAGFMVLLMIGFESLVIPPRERGQASLTVQQTTHPAPPAPNLQSDPVPELDRLNAAENQLLNHYARIDADHARIPIDRAMSLIIGRSLDPPQ